jgi:integrase
MIVCFQHALRASELISLKLGDIDWRNMEITIQREAPPENARRFGNLSRNEESPRHCVGPPETLEQLAAQGYHFEMLPAPFSREELHAVAFGDEQGEVLK